MTFTGDGKRKRRSSKPSKMVAAKPLVIPFFAHQPLDPARFSKAIGKAVCVAPPRLPPYDVRQSTTNELEEGEDTPEARVETGKSKPATESSALKRQETVASYKRMKLTGGRPAVQKKITIDLDSDDELLIQMKAAKYQEKEIAQRLKDEGRVIYHPKTIGSRWSRLKRKMQEKEDQLLDAELTDWHEGDDDALHQAIVKADKEYVKAMAALEEKKWRTVADEMKALKPVTNFSHKACRDRFEALQEGTAKATPESIEFPDENVLARVQSRQEKEQKLLNDIQLLGPNQSAYDDNVEGNAWTSRMKKYY